MKQSSRCCRLAALSQLTGVQSVTLAWLWLAPMRDPRRRRRRRATTTSVRPKKKAAEGQAARGLTPLREWSEEVVFIVTRCRETPTERECNASQCLRVWVLLAQHA